MSTVNSPITTAPAKAPYFPVNTTSLLSAVRIAAGGQPRIGHAELMTCLAQCAGVCSAVSDVDPVSTHGAFANMARTGLSQSATKNALRNLQQAGLLATAPAAPAGVLPARVTTTFTVHAADRPDVKLSSLLLQERGVNRQWRRGTLGHLYRKVMSSQGISRHLAVLDAICAFLYLHRHQDFAEYAGVDPAIVHGTCTPVGECPNGTFIQDIRPLAGNPAWSVVCVCKPAIDQISETAAAEAMPDVDPSVTEVSKPDRLRHALRELRKLGLISDVLVIWDRHPMHAGLLEPSVWGTLDAGDSDWRDERELHLLESVRQVVFGTGTLDRVEHLGHYSDRRADGTYHYIVPTHMARSAVVLAQYRAQRWADDEATLGALQADADRVEDRQEDFLRLICR